MEMKQYQSIFSTLCICVVITGALLCVHLGSAVLAAPASGMQVQEVSIDAAFFMWQKKEVTIIDVRTPDEFNEGHVPGAILIPVTELENRLDEVPANDVKVLLICRSGKRSANANILLQKHGFSNTYSVVGGISAWPGKLEK
ncbi:MAG TPA: rhodanese-like domain-containing protein [Patescibacteria group bacterium]|nr:rhodanese-like domain-containing protein [Patescibacteria group bacterium]